jgi:hypothetical protein
MLTLYRGVWPQNVSRLAKFGVRFDEGKWTVAVLYDLGSGLRYLALDKARDDLAAMVNSVKKAFSNTPGGAFYVNEHRHVIVPVKSERSAHYYFAGRLTGDLTFRFEGKPLSTRPIRSDGRPLQPGDKWVGPRPGIPYKLAAGARDIHYETPALTESDPPAVRPRMKQKLRLSDVLPSEKLVRQAVAPVAAIRGHEGGRFYVNEHGAMFTPVDASDGNGLDYIYCGMINHAAWFPEPRTS